MGNPAEVPFHFDTISVNFDSMPNNFDRIRDIFDTVISGFAELTTQERRSYSILIAPQILYGNTIFRITTAT